MSFELTILGSSAAVPAYNRHQSAQFLRIRDQGYLIDCGEGTQLLLKKYGIKHNKISKVFISHLHGDHFFGLIGLLSTMNLFGRQSPLTIFGPKGLAEILTLQFKYSFTSLCFELELIETDPNGKKLLYENDWLTIFSFPLAHRVPCTGFLFKEKPKKRRVSNELIPDIKHLGPSIINALKNGEDVLYDDGTIRFENNLYTNPPQKAFAYAYCSDTKYDERIVEYIEAVDLLYHESTFTNEHEKRALDTFHCTAVQAGKIAEMANVEKLLLGHFSNRYKELDQFLIEAKGEFNNVALAVEGQVFKLS